METFKQHILKNVEDILGKFGSNMWFSAVKPVVNLAKPELEKILTEKPEEVYSWLKLSKVYIDEAIAIYENENNKV